MIWLLSVNGFLMDIRQAPRGAQEEALRRGLIPYIPGDPRRLIKSDSLIEPTGPPVGPIDRVAPR